MSKQNLFENICKIKGIENTSFNVEELTELLDLPRGSDFQSSCMHILERLVEFKSSWPFLQSVKKEEVPDYYDVVKDPMDFQTMREKILEAKYKNRDQYISDVQKICDNARLYNTKNTIYYKCATELEKYAKEILVNLKNENRNDLEWETNYLNDWKPPQKITRVIKGVKNMAEKLNVKTNLSARFRKNGKIENGKGVNQMKRVKNK